MSGYVKTVFHAGMGAQFEPFFTEAAAFWNNVITVGHSGFTFEKNLNAKFRCGGVNHQFEKGYFLEGLEILAEISPIDGDGGILGQAGPCYFNDGFSAVGVMFFDSADAQGLLNGGSFGEVIVHEMGHVVGIGSSWANFDLVRNPCTGSAPCNSNPTYVGVNGLEGFHDLGGEGELLVGDERGPGTWNAHWREDVFQQELMSGFLNNAMHNPLSILSVKSLRDLGFEVNLDSAEAYEIPNPVARPFGGVSVPLVGEMLMFDAIDLKDEMRNIRAQIGNNNETETQITGLFAIMVLGFAMLAASMFYTSKKQSDAIKRLGGSPVARIVKEKVIEP